jgi:hypothetical protein
MTTQKSYLVSPEPLESIYDFLDLCEQILIAAFKHPDNNRLHLRQLDNIDQQCQAVQMMFVDELFKTSFTREDRSRILREFNAYLDDVLSWFQDAVQNGNMNRVTLSRLRKTRGTIFTEFISAERHAALAADSRTADILDDLDDLDDLDRHIILLYQKAELCRSKGGVVRYPSDAQIAQAAYRARITTSRFTKQAISKRREKLRRMGLMPATKDKAKRCPDKLIDDMQGDNSRGKNQGKDKIRMKF